MPLRDLLFIFICYLLVYCTVYIHGILLCNFHPSIQQFIHSFVATDTIVSGSNLVEWENIFNCSNFYSALSIESTLHCLVVTKEC